MTPRLRAGLIAAIAVLVLDQATKLWLLFVFDIGRRGAVRITPFFDLVLAWNTGISYRLVSERRARLAQIALTAIKAVAVIVLAIWMARSTTRLATLALGMIIGGAIGNAIDRFAYGAVVDFALFHVQIGEKTYNWYVFNLADAAIVAGVAALLYDSLPGVTRRKSALIPADTRLTRRLPRQYRPAPGKLNRLNRMNAMRETETNGWVVHNSSSNGCACCGLRRLPPASAWS